MDFTVRSASQIVFGWGRAADLGQHAASLGECVLLVAGRALAREGRLEDVIADIESGGPRAVLFDGVEPEPSLDTVRRGVELLRGEGCDVIVAVGGGSVMDVGKAIGAIAHAPGTIAHYHAGAEVVGPAVPIIAVPTTSGTGAEVTPNSVLTDAENGLKSSIRGAGLLPRIAVVDPELTLTCSPLTTAYSGLDALVQALEAYVSKGANPFSDPLALRAIEETGHHLRGAVEDGMDREAREQMALGSLLAGLALASARLGLVHGLAHPVGAEWKLPHGLVCAILMPHVIGFNAEVAANKYAEAARVLGLDPATPSEAGRALADWFGDLARSLRVEMTLSGHGAEANRFESMVEPTLASGSTKHNPRAATAEDVTRLLHAAL